VIDHILLFVEPDGPEVDNPAALVLACVRTRLCLREQLY